MHEYTYVYIWRIYVVVTEDRRERPIYIYIYIYIYIIGVDDDTGSAGPLSARGSSDPEVCVCARAFDRKHFQNTFDLYITGVQEMRNRFCVRVCARAY
jgi:hypothetical protein